jgi:hypothetical protein
MSDEKGFGDPENSSRLSLCHVFKSANGVVFHTPFVIVHTTQKKMFLLCLRCLRRAIGSSFLCPPRQFLSDLHETVTGGRSTDSRTTSPTRGSKVSDIIDQRGEKCLIHGSVGTMGSSTSTGALLPYQFRASAFMLYVFLFG